MYKKEIERKFLVNKSNMPSLSKYPKLDIKQGYLSQQHDSLTVRVRSTFDVRFDSEPTFELELKDDGELIRNEIGYVITKEEFETSFELCGTKTISKIRYLVPSDKNDGKILEVDVYEDFDFVTCEYEGESEVEVKSFISEDWFLKEVTYDNNYTNASLANNK